MLLAVKLQRHSLSQQTPTISFPILSSSRCSVDVSVGVQSSKLQLLLLAASSSVYQLLAIITDLIYEL